MVDVSGGLTMSRINALTLYISVCEREFPFNMASYLYVFTLDHF